MKLLCFFCASLLGGGASPSELSISHMYCMYEFSASTLRPPRYEIRDTTPISYAAAGLIFWPIARENLSTHPLAEASQHMYSATSICSVKMQLNKYAVLPSVCSADPSLLSGKPLETQRWRTTDHQHQACAAVTTRSKVTDVDTPTLLWRSLRCRCLSNMGMI